MAIEVPTFLVRYANYHWRTRTLSNEGLEQANAACDQLVAQGVGRRALVLSVIDHCASGTTETIIARTDAQRVDDEQARADLALVSRHPKELDVNPERFFEETIEDAGYTLRNYHQLVVVTRARLIGAIRGITTWQEANRSIPHGHVEEYQPGTWPARPPGGYPY